MVFKSLFSLINFFNKCTKFSCVHYYISYKDFDFKYMFLTSAFQCTIKTLGDE